MAKLAFFTEAQNALSFFSKATESILGQTYTDFVWYVAEDASTDGTRALLEEYAAKDARIRPRFFDKADMYGNFNRVLAEIYASDALYLALLDADDWYEPDFAETLIRLLETSGADLAEARFCAHYEADATLLEPQPSLGGDLILSRAEYAREFDTLSFFDFFQQWWGKIYRVPLLRECKLFPDVGWDTVFVLRYRLASAKIAVSDRVLHHYLVRQASDCHKALSSYSVQNAVYALFELHSLRLQLLSACQNPQSFLMAQFHDSNGVKAEFLRLYESRLSPEEKAAAIPPLLQLPYLRDSFRAVREEFENRGTFFLCSPEAAQQAMGDLASGYLWALRTVFKEASLDAAPLLFDWLRCLCPHLERFFEPQNLALLLEEAPLQTALLNRDFRRARLLCVRVQPMQETALLKAFICCETGTDPRFCLRFYEKNKVWLTDKQKAVLEGFFPRPLSSIQETK